MKKSFAFICAAILVAASIACAAPAMNEASVETDLSATATPVEDEVSMATTADQLLSLTQMIMTTYIFARSS